MKHLKPLTVDRFEGEYAILIDNIGRSYDVLRDELPGDSLEGDVLHENGGIFIVDEELTKEKREKIQRLREQLSQK